MKFALLTHSYHKVTKSAEFLAALLLRLGSVTTYFDESWVGRQADWVATFEPRAFDCIVILQAHECFQYVNTDHPNIVFVPMYDAMIWNGGFYWKEIFNCAKVLCFSSALNQEIVVRNPVTVYFQYYPDPKQYPSALDYSAPRGYYWRRRNEIGNSVIEGITKGFTFAQFTLQDVPDPGSSIAEQAHRLRVTSSRYSVTGWHPSEKDYLKQLSEHNIYFAPRIREGIGFGFLKAMSMGLCVVAPDTATHNEYISQGCTGVLYSPDKPDALDLHLYRERGARARESIERGHRRWEARSDEFLDFLAMPKSAYQQSRFSVDSWIKSPHRHAPMASSTASARLPSVAVVTVCLNARNVIEKTILSVIEQDYPGLEYVILDGASIDGTVDVIRKFEESLAFWTSSPDEGVYPAMQKALGHVKSEWVLFMNAGDFFSSADALRRLFSAVPRNAEVTYGHHIYRHTSGVDELRLAADFGWMWSRLQEGQFDVQYPVGFPAHQATAVRTRLLRKLKFDPLFRIAADHDLLWRAFRRGAVFFAADEIVSVYVGGGYSAKQMERCKQEWCVIAMRYGPRTGARQFINCSYTDAAKAIELDYGNRGDRLVTRFTETPFGRIPGIAGLAETTAKFYLWAAKKLYLNRYRSLAPANPLLLFKRDHIITFLSETHGLSEPEEWGAWSDGETVELVFREYLPASFKLVLRARTFGRNARGSIRVTVGGMSRQMTMKGEAEKQYSLTFFGNLGESRMTFAIPYPVAPADLQPPKSQDRRRLGLGFVSMRIEPNS